MVGTWIGLDNRIYKKPASHINRVKFSSGAFYCSVESANSDMPPRRQEYPPSTRADYPSSFPIELLTAFKS